MSGSVFNRKRFTFRHLETQMPWQEARAFPLWVAGDDLLRSFLLSGPALPRFLYAAAIRSLASLLNTLFLRRIRRGMM